MSKEFRNVSFAFTVNDSEHIADNIGSVMYADDVVDEIYEVLNEALMDWYSSRGYMLLASEPV